MISAGAICVSSSLADESEMRKVMEENGLAMRDYIVNVKPDNHLQDVRIVIANAILSRSKVQRSQKIAICVTTSRHSQMHKRIQPFEHAQYCGKIISILLIVLELEHVQKKMHAGYVRFVCIAVNPAL